MLVLSVARLPSAKSFMPFINVSSYSSSKFGLEAPAIIACHLISFPLVPLIDDGVVSLRSEVIAMKLTMKGGLYFD